MRFYKKIMNEKLFSDQETGVNACFVIGVSLPAGFCTAEVC